MSKDNTAEHRYLFHNGRNYRSYEYFGAHKCRRNGKDGYIFRVWAPRAAGISLVGDFNGWDVSADPFEQIKDDESIWECFSDRIEEGGLYKFVVTSDNGQQKYKADPYAFRSEFGDLAEGSLRASILYDVTKPFDWGDADWLKKRDSRNPYQSPMNIYEVHLGSWKRKEDGSDYSYRELADMLIPYVQEMGYTHLELLPVMEHPFDGSWGYQITGYYSVTGRYGTPDEFRYFIDQAHKAGIGVILDWVPGHFPKDEHGLYEFDGYPLYEYTDPKKMEHKGWGTRAFDFGRPEVISFLISNAFYFCEKFHADGLRVDAVAAMLYLNYDRPDGEWTANEDGGVENKEAISFLQQTCEDVLINFPGVMMIAEESTAWPNVTKPPQIGGLGFNFKWNMGWMNDVLEYFQTDMLFRKGVHNKLTFALTYAYSENFILPISHDEVVHGKRSLLDKMPGSYEDKFAGLRSFLVFMYTHPGKKLNFMGNEFGQFIEWNEKQGLDWVLLQYETHAKTKDFVKALNHYYRSTPALWQTDDTYDGFRWIDADNSSDNVYTYFRIGPEKEEEVKAEAKPLKKEVSKAKAEEEKEEKEEPRQICEAERACENRDVALTALNLSGKDFPEYDIGVPDASYYIVVVDSDREEYGGTGSRKETRVEVKEGMRNGFEHFITISLPKLSAVILERR